MSILRDLSTYGKASCKSIYVTLLKGGKLLSADTYADIQIRAHSSDEDKYLNVTFSSKNDIPKITLSTNGITPTSTVISGVDQPVSNTDVANKQYVDNSIVYKPMDVITTLTGNYTLDNNRINKHSVYEVGFTDVMTIPTNASFPAPIGSEYAFTVLIGPGPGLTITASTGVFMYFAGMNTNASGLTVILPNTQTGATITLKKLRTDSWAITGPVEIV